MAYRGILCNRGKIVSGQDAFDYALKRVTENKEEKSEFLEWYYSGNWIEIEDDTEID